MMLKILDFDRASPLAEASHKYEEAHLEGCQGLSGRGRAALADLQRELDVLRGAQRGEDIGGGDADTVLIQGENLMVLKGVRDALRGRVKCVYIDPPYNNKETYSHYSDDLSHEHWLDSIRYRLAVIADLLAEDGSVWISIDDREMHYLKVEADKIFGRKNFIATVVWEHRTTRENRKVFSSNHEYVLVYAKSAQSFKCTRNPLPATEEVLARYRNVDGDPRGPWQSVSANVQAGHGTPAQFYELISPCGVIHRPPPGRCWVYTKERMDLEIQSGNVYFGKNGAGVPRLKRFPKDLDRAITPETLWPASTAGTTTQAKKHTLCLFGNDVFDTPKPESLIMRILQIATNPGDLVLDAYLGSGTTCAVAHKMGRPSVGIEEGPHAVTHCLERMRQVILGETGGVSTALGWTGGGSCAFYKVDSPATRSTESDTLHLVHKSV